jgi:ubiquinone/menaquinone biosynthesis C-methylase UbiE
MVEAIKNILHRAIPHRSAKKASEAYDMWSETYDFQPGNLMLDLDEEIVTDLLKQVDWNAKTVVDVGCGTGRHWSKLQKGNPASLTGFDVSAGMLNRLQAKFPGSRTMQTTDNRLWGLPDSSVDFLLTTLTIAHIQNPEEAIQSWSRVLKNGGALLLTDFHPEMLKKGGRRSFSHKGKSLSVVNYIHPLPTVKYYLEKHGFTRVAEKEKFIDATLKHYYVSQNALPVFERFKGVPVIYGLLLRKHLDTQ